MREFRLAGPAALDLRDMHAFGVAEFGEEQAFAYADVLQARLQRLAEFPELGVLRTDLPKATRSFPSGSRVIYYLPTDYGILVLRILHGSRDPVRHL